MNALRQILPALCGAALGFALGTIRVTDARRTGAAPAANDHPAGKPDARFAPPTSEDDAVTEALTALIAGDDFRQLARLGALLDRLDSAQMPALFDKLARLPAEDREILFPRLLAYWTKRDPQAATEWMQPRLARYAKEQWFGAGSANFDTNLVNAWVENAPEFAVEYARQCPDTGLGETILHNAISDWPDKDDARRLEVLRTFPPGKARDAVIASLCSTWAYSDRAGAFAAASALPPSPARTTALGEILARWAGADPAVAFEKAEALGLTDPGWLTIMVNEAAQRDLAATVRWLAAHEGSVPPQAASVLAGRWAEKDPAAAFAWALAGGVSLVDSPRITGPEFSGGGFMRYMAMSVSPFSTALGAKPEATLAWVRVLPAGADRDRYIELASRTIPKLSIAQPLLAELPPEAAARAAGSIAGRLASEQIAQAQQWAESLAGPMRQAAWAAIGATRSEPLPLPPGPDRDAMLGAIATAWATQTPVKSLDRALEIADPALRRQTFDDVMWKLHRGRIDLGDGGWEGGASEAALAAARTWLERAKIPEEWKRAWRG